MSEEKNEMVKEAAVEYEYLTGEEDLQRIAFLKRKYELDYNSGMANAEKRGIEKNKKETAQKLLKLNMPIDQIIEVTGLTKEEIEKLR